MPLRQQLKLAETHVPYGGLLSSSCKGLQRSAASKEPFRPKGVFARQTDRWTNGQRVYGLDSAVQPKHESQDLISVWFYNFGQLLDRHINI